MLFLALSLAMLFMGGAVTQRIGVGLLLVPFIEVYCHHRLFAPELGSLLFDLVIDFSICVSEPDWKRGSYRNIKIANDLKP